MTTTLPRSFLAVLLTLSLLLPSLLPLTALAQAQPGSPENAANKDRGEGESPGGSGTGQEGSPEHAGQAGQAAADSVSVNAAAMGVDVSITPNDADNVTVNGVDMSVSQANEAISAIAEAEDAGLPVSPNSDTPGIDVAATLSAHARGETGVVGRTSGVRGTPSQVMDAEVSVASARAATAVGTAAGSVFSPDIDRDRFGPSDMAEKGDRVGVPNARELAEARMYAPVSLPAWTLGTPVNIMNVALTPTVLDAINKADSDKGKIDSIKSNEETATPSSKDESTSGIPTPSSRRDDGEIYSFDPKTGSFVDSKGKQAGVDSFFYGTIENLDTLTSELSKAKNVTAVVNPEGNVTITQTTSGKVASFNMGDIDKISSPVAEISDDSVGQTFGQSYSGPKGAGSLNDAARYAARVASNQQPVIAPTTDPERAAKAAAAISMEEDPDQEGQKLAIDIATNRAIATGKPIDKDIASPAYQPIIGEIARGICSCNKPSKETMRSALALSRNPTEANKALDRIIARQEKNPAFEYNYTYAKAVINGTQPISAITKDNKGFNAFTNVPLSLSQGLASKKTIERITEMKADENSITLRSGKYNEQTFGIRSDIKVADLEPQKKAFDPTTLPETVIPVEEYTPETSPTTKPSIVPGLPNLDRVVAPVGDFLKDIGDWLSQFGGGSYNLDIEDNQGEPDTENCNLYPVVPCNDQAGAVILAINEYLVLKPLERLFFNDLTSNENSVSGFKKPNLTVLMTINYQSGEISLDRPDISATLEDPYTYYSETEYQNLLKLLNEEPVVFDENDQIWYSNGLFSPPVVDGISVEDSNTPNYTYVTRYIDQDGQTIEMDNNDSKLPENLFTKVIKGAFQNSSSFGITDVSYVTYRLVDPNVSIPYDEYYDYIIGLKSGETRSTVLPQYTSYSFTEKRLKGVGYQGDIMSLMSQAIEVFEAPKKGLGLRLVDGVVNYFTKFVDMFTSKNETMVATDFPTINYDLNTNDIERIFIYPNAVTFCEEITESSAGFVYVAVLKDRSDPKYNTVITDGRCGYGGVDDWVEETATQLEVKYEIKNVTFDNIINKTFIRTEEVALIPGIDVVETGPVEVDNDIGIDEDVISDEANSEEQQVVISNQLPNLTNTISFEVKAVGSSGSVLSDWTSAESIDIGSGVQLYFRWNGSDYAQCLPFLNDNGNYALTVSNRAMITGDTESEGYNVPERTATYRIECGGQRNNEFGVDYREVNVTVQ